MNVYSGDLCWRGRTVETRLCHSVVKKYYHKFATAITPFLSLPGCQNYVICLSSPLADILKVRIIPELSASCNFCHVFVSVQAKARLDPA